MAFLRHRQRAITSLSPVPGQGRWINPNKAGLAPTAQEVFDGAGFRGTPGFTGSPGQTGAPEKPSDDGALVTRGLATQAIIITDTADAIRYQSVFGAGTGDGSAGNPYLIANINCTKTQGAEGVISYDTWVSDFNTFPQLITGAPSGATANLLGVLEDTPDSTGRLMVDQLTGSFAAGDTITGATDGQADYVSLAGSGSCVQWDDTSAPYYVEIFDSTVIDVDGSASGKSTFLMAAHVDSHLLFSQSDTRMTLAGAAAVGHFEAISGCIDINLMYIDRTRVPMAVLNGSDCSINVNESNITDDDNSWSGQLVFQPFAVGGSHTVTNTTFNFNQVSMNPNIFALNAGDAALTVTSCKFNTEANSDLDKGLGSLIAPGDPVVAPRVLPKVFTDCEIWGGNERIVTSNPTSNALKNVTFDHCSFSLHTVGKKVMVFGPEVNSTALDDNFSENILISWCRFDRFDGGGNYQLPGNEVIDSHRAENLVIHACWTDECGEDVYEWHVPQNNNVVRYSGGGKEGDTGGGTGGIHGQMVDFFLRPGNTGTYTGNKAHDIWGVCGGQAVSVSDRQSIELHNILVDNSADINGLPPEATISLINLVDGVLPALATITGQITQDSQCKLNTAVDPAQVPVLYTRAPAETPS